MMNFEEKKKMLLAKKQYDTADLVVLLQVLRDPENGCPWDRIQTHHTIRNDFIEETYEAIEAIDTDNPVLLREELGDVLLQVAFHAGIEEDAGRFDFEDVVDALCKKLIYRHPHVFGNEAVTDADDVLVTWNRQKNLEKTERVTVTDQLNAVPKMLPALVRAAKVGKRASCFDFPDASSVMDKLREESAEVEDAVRSGDEEQIFEEMRTKLKDKESILDGLEQDNPFRDSFKVTLTDLNATQAVYDQVNAIEGVANITAFQEVAGILTNVTRTVKNVSFWVVIILCIIAAFIISNTIKLSVFARRKEINIMKYIGATDWFIRWPFVIEGILIGLYGAIISFVLIWIVYDRIYASIQIGYFELLPFSAIMWVIIGAFVAVGTVIGAVGSIISIRKHLKV